MKIVGLSGTNGAGKDTVAEMLVERHNFLFVSAGDLFGDIAKSKGLTSSRANKAKISAQMRREKGMGALVELAIEQFKQTKGYNGLVVGSLRHPGEAELVNQNGGVCVWVDADPQVRYQRITSNVREGREHEDQLSFEDWQTQENYEMTHSGDKATLNTSAVKPLCQLKLENNADNIETFQDSAEKALMKYIA